MPTAIPFSKILTKFKDNLINEAWDSPLITNTQKSDDLWEISTPFPCNTQKKRLTEALLHHMHTHTPDTPFSGNLELTSNIPAFRTANQAERLPGVHNIIAISSTKGGVGKSTLTANLALALQQEGARVGILDADVYGPNQPQLLGPHQQAEMDDSHYFPVMQHGLATMSMGYLVKPDTPLAWRGPMATAYLTQMLRKTRWPELDYLLIDMPPGTGDIQLSIAQKVPITAAVLVTTPQCLSLADLEKGLGLFKKMQIPVLGLIENMAQLICSHCGHANQLFASNNTQSFLSKHDLPLLGSLALSQEIADSCENNTPLLLANNQHPLSQAIATMAYTIGFQLGRYPRHIPNPFPPIVAE